MVSPGLSDFIVRNPRTPVAIIDHAAEPAFFGSEILRRVSIRVKFTHTEPFTTIEPLMVQRRQDFQRIPILFFGDALQGIGKHLFALGSVKIFDRHNPVFGFPDRLE